ncbi:hypothetical protein ANCCEY_00897 [Ancylostoma ceylanicum]|uniref:Uncharacterized protein n=1 Tax=Ancylostoma ceylanicum TaxID=53326 RepID=A0A0D6M7D0_9BILA|nr:hypothetical protein ANCCEY_00897 [Ancylostoma ceylanicum]
MLTYAILAIVAINAAFVTFMIIWEADYVDWFHSQCDHSCADTVYMPNLFEKPVELKMNTSKEYFKKEPIWSLFKKAKMGKVASFFWKGPFAEKSEYETPDYHMNFDPTATDKDQLDQIVKWLRKPKETRPNLVMVNFDHAKYIGFHHKTKKQNWTISIVFGVTHQHNDMATQRYSDTAI